MVEAAQPRAHHALREGRERVALPYLPRRHLLAGEPASPGRGSAGAIARRSGEDRVGVDERTVGREAQCRRAAGRAAHLAVRDVDPAPACRGEGGAAVGKEGPWVARRRHGRLRRHGHDAGAEASRQPQPVRVGRPDRTERVRPAAGCSRHRHAHHLAADHAEAQHAGQAVAQEDAAGGREATGPRTQALHGSGGSCPAPGGRDTTATRCLSPTGAGRASATARYR